MVRAAAIAVLLGVASCTYAYTVAPCTVRCGVIGNDDCPPGFACLGDSFCHASELEAMCPCRPLTCGEIQNSCGALPDTCGGTNQCGGCTSPLECGGGGTPFVCGDPASCVPQACKPDQCGPITDTCGNAATCPNCPAGKKCDAGACVPCTATCAEGDLACGDDKCGGSCGTCPDQRWDCHPQGVCCIRDGEQCQPLLEGCNCCPGLFCISGFCTPAAGCSMAADLGGEVPVATP